MRCPDKHPDQWGVLSSKEGPFIKVSSLQRSKFLIISSTLVLVGHYQLFLHTLLSSSAINIAGPIWESSLSSGPSDVWYVEG